MKKQSKKARRADLRAQLQWEIIIWSVCLGLALQKLSGIISK